jgi:hypothetical protein
MKIRLHVMAVCLLAAAGPIRIATAPEATPAITLLDAREQLLAAFDGMPQVRLSPANPCLDRRSDYVSGGYWSNIWLAADRTFMRDRKWPTPARHQSAANGQVTLQCCRSAPSVEGQQRVGCRC